MTGIPPLSIGRVREARAVKLPRALRVNEEQLHRSVVEYLRVAFPNVLFLHVPNGGKRSKSEAARLKAMGTLAGAPDLLLWWSWSFDMGAIFGQPNEPALQAGPCFHSAAIELKSGVGRQSPEQKAFQAVFTGLGGHYAVCRSIEDVRISLEGWGVKGREGA